MLGSNRQFDKPPAQNIDPTYAIDGSLLRSAILNTLNSWVRGHHAIPQDRLADIQQALKEWEPDSRSFRLGGRSPWE